MPSFEKNKPNNIEPFNERRNNPVVYDTVGMSFMGRLVLLVLKALGLLEAVDIEVSRRAWHLSVFARVIIWMQDLQE